jgi:hypothetical protein
MEMRKISKNPVRRRFKKYIKKKIRTTIHSRVWKGKRYRKGK